MLNVTSLFCARSIDSSLAFSPQQDSLDVDRHTSPDALEVRPGRYAEHQTALHVGAPEDRVARQPTRDQAARQRGELFVRQVPHEADHDRLDVIRNGGHRGGDVVGHRETTCRS